MSIEELLIDCLRSRMKGKVARESFTQLHRSLALPLIAYSAHSALLCNLFAQWLAQWM